MEIEQAKDECNPIVLKFEPAIDDWIHPKDDDASHPNTRMIFFCSINDSCFQGFPCYV
jgi:hypothetical protein